MIRRDLRPCDYLCNFKIPSVLFRMLITFIKIFIEKVKINNDFSLLRIKVGDWKIIFPNV